MTSVLNKCMLKQFGEYFMIRVKCNTTRVQKKTVPRGWSRDLRQHDELGFIYIEAQHLHVSVSRKAHQSPGQLAWDWSIKIPDADQQGLPQKKNLEFYSLLNWESVKLVPRVIQYVMRELRQIGQKSDRARAVEDRLKLTLSELRMELGLQYYSPSASD